MRKRDTSLEQIEIFLRVYIILQHSGNKRVIGPKRFKSASCPPREDLTSDNRTEIDKRRCGKHGVESNVDYRPLNMCFFEDSGYFSLMIWEKGVTASSLPVLKNHIKLAMNSLLRTR